MTTATSSQMQIPTATPYIHTYLDAFIRAGLRDMVVRTEKINFLVDDMRSSNGWASTKALCGVYLRYLILASPAASASATCLTCMPPPRYG